MNNPSAAAALANLEAQPLGRAHLVSLHAIASRTPDEDMRELARKRYHTLTADQQRRHAAYVLTYPAVHPVDHLQMVIGGGRPVEVVNHRVTHTNTNNTNVHTMSTLTPAQALDALCNILNKTGFTLDGGTADPEYLESAELYAEHIVETFHTNSR